MYGVEECNHLKFKCKRLVVQGSTFWTLNFKFLGLYGYKHLHLNIKTWRQVVGVMIMCDCVKLCDCWGL